MSAEGKGTAIEDAVAYQLHRTNRLLLTHLGRFVASHHSELTPETYFILMKLHEAGPLPQSALVEVALEDGPNVSRLVDRLVKAGLVERQENPDDRRARVLDLGEEGREVARRIVKELPAGRELIFEGITSAEIESLRSILRRLNDNARPTLRKDVSS